MKMQTKQVLLLFSLIVTTGIYVGTSQANDRKLRFIMKSADDRANFVYSQISVPDLPDTGLLRTGLTVNENILTDPAKATLKGGVLGKLDDFVTAEPWIGGIHNFRAHYHIKNPEPLPTKLPPEMEKRTRERLAERKKRNPKFDIEKYLEKLLKGHRKSKELLGKGQLTVKIINAPNPQAAFEYLVAVACDCSLMSDAIIGQFDESNKLEDIGTVGYWLDRRGDDAIRFIRDNIAVIIRGDDEFEAQVVEIARKIDQRLLQQPLLTYEQLQARRPQVTFSHKRYKIIRQKGRLPVSKPDEIYCEVSVPEGKKYTIRDSKIDGKGNSFKKDISFKKGRKAYYEDRREDKTKPLRIEMTVVSDELLVTRVSRDVAIQIEQDEE